MQAMNAQLPQAGGSRRLVQPRTAMLAWRGASCVAHRCVALDSSKKGVAVAASPTASLDVAGTGVVRGSRPPQESDVPGLGPSTQTPINTPPAAQEQAVVGTTSLQTTSSSQDRSKGPQPPGAVDTDPGGPPLRAEDAWAAFEARLEADLQTVMVTLVAIIGVICLWRGVWSLLDYYLGDNPVGDVACILCGFGIILYIRLSGLKIGGFWPQG